MIANDWAKQMIRKRNVLIPLPKEKNLAIGQSMTSENISAKEKIR